MTMAMAARPLIITMVETSTLKAVLSNLVMITTQ